MKSPEHLAGTLWLGLAFHIARGGIGGLKEPDKLNF